MWCALALVLLLDSSGSVDGRAWDLQVQAHADALADPAIGRAMAGNGLTAVTVISFDSEPRTLVPWRVVDVPADAHALAREIAAVERPSSMLTRTGAAIAYAMAQLARAPCEGERRVIDLVTDGPGDDAARLAVARDEAIASDVRINVLTVETYPGAHAAQWAREHVATPGGFVMETDDWADVARALRRKVAREVSGR